MRRRQLLDLAAASIVLGAITPSSLRADCMPNEEHAHWLTTNVHAGGDAIVWLGQPRGLPVPTDLEVTIGGAARRLPIVWIVPGVARIRIPASASGTVRIATPQRGRNPAGATFDVVLASGPPPARICAPPTSLSIVRASHPIRWGTGQSATAQFTAAPPSIRHVIARWASFGSFSTIAAGASSATLYDDGGCGSTPVDVAIPAPGARVEVCFVDDEGNLSAFTSAVMPG